MQLGNDVCGYRFECRDKRCDKIYAVAALLCSGNAAGYVRVYMFFFCWLINFDLNLDEFQLLAGQNPSLSRPLSSLTSQRFYPHLEARHALSAPITAKSVNAWKKCEQKYTHLRD